MRRQFSIPEFYRSNAITRAKQARRDGWRKGSPMPPTEINLGNVNFKLAMLFGLCFGVENAIDIAYRALDENPDKRVFLLSQMIHNPRVNSDLEKRGIKFLFTPEGEELLPLSDLTPDDIVIIPAFGATIEMSEKLKGLGVKIESYDTTCPFVEKVWRRAEQLGRDNHTIVIHGKHSHEETKATFSHASSEAPSIVVKDLEETKLLAKFIDGSMPLSEFDTHFKERATPNFIPEKHLVKVGVVNQTTMLASETIEIASLVKNALARRYGEASIKEHYADTRDTLCYATYENQSAMLELVASGGDLALIIGGANSSNTSHLVEIAEQVLPTYFIQEAGQLSSLQQIEHFSLHSKKLETVQNWLPEKRPLSILISAGASTPDIVVEEVLTRLSALFQVEQEFKNWLSAA